MKGLLFTAAVIALAATAPAFADEPDGLILPKGFHASIVADGLTGIRHLAFAPNGDLYASTTAGRDQPAIGIYALHLDKNHKADKTEKFGNINGGTGIRVYKGGLYA